MRHKDWSTRLSTFISENANRQFEWGRWDCCLFAADAVKAITGEDLAADFRGRYKTERGALRALKKYGKGAIKETLASKLGTEKTPLQATRGDIALVDRPGGDAAGVVSGVAIIVITPEGMAQIPITAAKVVWSVE